MSDYIPISASHLSLIVVWLNDKGITETVESPILCADMSCEPPRLVPAIHAAVPEGAPVRRVVHDSKAGIWFDTGDGTAMREWRAVVAPLHAMWSAAQPAPQPAAPKASTPLEVPRVYNEPPPKPPHRLNTIPHPRDVQE